MLGAIPTRIPKPTDSYAKAPDGKCMRVHKRPHDAMAHTLLLFGPTIVIMRQSEPVVVRPLRLGEFKASLPFQGHTPRY